MLARDYDPQHEVIIYKAATLPLQQPRCERIALRELPHATLDLHATLVIPPARALEPDVEIRERLNALDAAVPVPSVAL